MARLGKRERKAKADLIAANVNAPREPAKIACGPAGFGGSTLALDKLHSRTHHVSAYGANGGMGRNGPSQRPTKARFSQG